mmetsp:Transcript_87688/g.256338  ORF Transcript_87688/g.256338 Transcript_87688/m.256338 type:complete len:208 (+) Transcript_87688:446-1069(+)
MLGLHLASVVRVVHGTELQGIILLTCQTKYSDGGVPVVHNKHVLALFVQREIARGRAMSAAAAELLQQASFGADGPGDNLARLSHGLRASIEHVLARVEAHEGWIHDGVLGDREQHHLPIARVHVEDVEAPLCLCAFGPVREVVEARVAGDDDELLKLWLGTRCRLDGRARGAPRPGSTVGKHRCGLLDGDVGSGSLHGARGTVSKS